MPVGAQESDRQQARFEQDLSRFPEIPSHASGGRFGDTEVLGDLRQRSFVLPVDLDNFALEPGGVGLCAQPNPSCGNTKSSQFKSQLSQGQFRRVTPGTVIHGDVSSYRNSCVQ